MENIFSQRVNALRQIMSNKGWDAVVLTGSDPHNSEYPAERWKQVQWLSGFTGEAGDMVITQDHAGLWTDTRYFIQANKQLEGTGIELHKTRIPEQILIPEWLSQHAFKDRNIVNIAIDGLCQSVSAVEDIVEAFDEETNLHIVNARDLLDQLWNDRPSVPQTPAIILQDYQTGESRQEKIQWIKEFISDNNADSILISALDDIAWLLNVRGSDIEYNPYLISYLIVDKNSVKWFVKREKFFTAELQDVEILPYYDIDIALSELEGRLIIDAGSLNYNLYSLIQEKEIISIPSPISLRKAIKNATEIEGMKQIHIQDGIAMEKFFYWLESSIKAGQNINEWDAAVKLGKYREEIEGYNGDSFETISAYGENAALPHYVTPHHNAPELKAEGLYLCDSGGQYFNGTTDITRTIALGPCSELEKEDYTLVLKAHIGLASAVFPKGTAGCQLDALARIHLWKTKRNFGHGTGHGVGYFLGVHEGPQDIRQNFNTQALLPGMITSDEPGIYREGMHGIRHENLILCKEAGSNSFGSWLEFETITLCHFDTSIIIKDLMTQEEINWLNAYNKRVYDTLSPALSPEIASWLEEKTKAI